MSEKKGKERKKINPFDVVVILLVVCLLISFGYKIYAGFAGEVTANVSEYILEFEGESCRSIFDYLGSGEAVYLSAGGELIGYFYAEEDDSNGHVYLLSDPLDEEQIAAEEENPYETVRFGGKIRLSANAVRVKNGDYFTLGDINLTKGSVIEVYTEKAAFTIMVKGFDTVHE